MADVKENAFTTKSPVAAGDKLRGIGGSDSESYNMLVQDVAKYIIENYNGSSVAGSAQSVKAALDSLNSKTGITIIIANTVTEIQGVLDSAYEQIPTGGSFGTILWSNHGYYPFFAIKPNTTRGYVNMWYAANMYSLGITAGTKTYYRFVGTVLS